MSNYSKEDKERLSDDRLKEEKDNGKEYEQWKQYEKDAKQDVNRGWGRKAGS
ncbi:MAG: hypothetical protein KME52_09880 [Desmonostoc geniculatum HA4340-LM1]|nr:hypothetical protein [Desmonostoc geniculatum HA4340-LM1]